MDPFQFVIALVAVIMIGRVVQSRFAARDAQTHPQRDDGDAVRLRDEVRALKERVQVLERVVTDNHGSNDLGRQIEQLRDR